ncbi:MAG: molecular chaperone DnaJ [Gammaproteobacteria bacterium]|nr:molecular chaperone DnaJ [Gammaproteobacteria bacterium]MBU1480951.1 molecular chaperone DnaJ [Gammaproteobacteria bacterium]
MTTQRDYYEVLGVAKDADQKAIKDAFRTLAMKYHPDRNKEPGAEEHFKEIAEAYAILSDPKKRSEYDARGFAGVEGFSQEDLFGGINFDDIFGGLNFDFGGGGLFDSFFHRRGRHAGPARGANIEVELDIPLERVASGGEEKVHLGRPAPCHACHGTGSEGGVAPKICATCQGSGRITHSSRQEKNHVLIQQISTCPACHGRGSIIEHPCSVCHGSGNEDREETLTVKIPQGVEEGMALRIPGKGMPSPEAGGASGDLFVVVRAKPDPRFQRAGADLLRQETIALTDAVLGTKLDVPTLDGSASVTIPPGIQPGAILRVKGKGLPEFGSARHGELYLRIEVKIPERLSHDERELYERLRALGDKTPATSAGHWWQKE